MSGSPPYFIALRRSGFQEAEYYSDRTTMIAEIVDREAWRCDEDVVEVLVRDADGVRIEDRGQLDRECEEYLADLEAERHHRGSLRVGAR